MEPGVTVEECANFDEDTVYSIIITATLGLVYSAALLISQSKTARCVMEEVYCPTAARNEVLILLSWVLVVLILAAQRR